MRALISRSQLYSRLQSGPRSPAADLGLRATGLLLIAGCAALALHVAAAYRAAPHPATAGEFAALFAAFALWGIGAALLVLGQGLFRRYPLPPRALLAFPRPPISKRSAERA